MEELMKKICSRNGIERGELVKYIAEMNDMESEEFVSEIKKLMQYKDSTVNLFAFDKKPETLLHKFWQRKSDACPLECTEAEDQENEWENWICDEYFKIEY